MSAICRGPSGDVARLQLNARSGGYKDVEGAPAEHARQQHLDLLNCLILIRVCLESILLVLSRI